MNISELDSFNLADAVKFHNRLNPRLWDSTENLKPEVREKLLAIAADFQEFLGVSDLDVVDITVSGSNAAYSYTPNSDIDLHLVVRMPEQNSEVYQELFNAKKYQYNNEHDIRIGGADVELYVQPADQPHHSQGIYSVVNNDWLQVPRRRRAHIDDHCVQHKTEDLAARIDQAIGTESLEQISRLWDKIKAMRLAGLDQSGEFGCDNLAFKMLRRSGHLGRLKQAKLSAQDRALSLTEKKRRSKSRFKYGSYGGWFYPGYSFHSGETSDGGGDGGESVKEVNTGMAQGSSIGDSGAQSTWDGVSPDTDEFLSEQQRDASVVRDFIRDTARRLGIEQIPQIRLHQDSDWSEQSHSFGRFEPESRTLHVNMHDRHLMDILRTVAHELVHCRQHELNPLPDSAGHTGSPWENQAHAKAGEIMRDFADAHPELFESSGYIPTKKQANDPRFAMALTVDVKPGQTGKEANKMALKTDAQGRPGLLMKSVNLREGRMPQPSQGSGAYRDLNQPLGPETPPTMPAGTVRVDVSDVYDWYKLGQHISNMKGLGKHDFGAGPPSSIISFGDEETEHKFIKDLAATGLDVTDIDPQDPKQPAGMRRIKTDPTYNVAEADAARTAKSAIDQTEVFGVRGYRARCLEPGCEWHSRSYDRIKQAQDSAKKHAAAHIKPDVTEGSLEEGVNDPHIFKAIAMIGPMGAGKSTIARQLVGGSGLRSLNLDNFNELLIKQGKVAGGNLTPDQLERSWQLTQAQKGNWVDGRLGLLIDGSGRNVEGLVKPLLQLEALGYDTMVILVNVSLETSLQRQQSRAAQQAQQYGTGRNVPADLAKSSYDQIQQNIPKLQQLYGNKLLIINNEGAVDLTQEKTIVDRFLSAPPSKPAAVEWIKSHGASQGQQLDKRLAQQQRQQSSVQRAPTYTQQGVAEGKQPGKSVVDAILRVMPVAQEIWFHGSRATGKHRRNSDTDILVVVPDDLVGDQYLGAVRILQKLSSQFDNHDIQPTKAGTNIHRIAQEEGRLLWSNKQGVAESELVESLRREFELLEDEFIGEIKMSPSNLRAEAAQTGARAGMEFEMIVPGARRSNFNDVALDFMNAIGMDSVAVGEYHGSGGYEQWDGSGWTDVRQDDYSDDPEMEPDYDQDESCRSIDDAVQFFHDGDYNGHREVQRLREKMENDFQEWLTERIDRDWDSDGEDFVRDWVAENVDDSEWRDLVDDDTTEQEAFDEFASNVHADPNNDYHQSALDEYREENYGNYDESDWLDAEDLDRMSAIESAYDIRWPYYIVGQDDNVDPKKPSNIYTVEPDGSLAPNNRVIVGADGKQYKTYRNQSGQAEADKQFLNRWQGRMKKQDPDYVDQDYRVVEYNESETGLEFVSPPLPIDKLFDDLKKIRAWAKKNKITTNDSTGLHINVSVPEFSNDKLDYVKLALLLGDQYVLDQFGRSSNTYTKSALGIVKDRVRKNPNTAQAMLDKMREHMKDLATKAIHSGETDKYTSINTKEGYIEFRSPGGDWLDENFDKVENTLLRFTVALKAAMDPEAYREEYLKKLYKLLEPTAEGDKGADTVRYFADYVAGKIPAAALRSFVKQAQLQRRIAKEPASGKQYWWRVYKDGRDARNTAMIEVVASSEQEARDKAAAEFGIFSSEYKAYMDAVVLRPYVETETEYEIFQVAGNRVVQTFRAADNDAALAYFDRTISAGDRPYYDVRRAGSMAATQAAAQQPAGGFEFELSQTDIENRLGWPDQTADANYEVVNRNTLQPVYLFIANTDQDAARKYSQIIQAMGMPGAAENYGYRARGSRMTPVAGQGTQSGSQRPARGGNFTGVWLILDPDGDVIHSFAGVGNVQSDANRVAMQWLRANPGAMQAGVTVVPEML